MKGIVVLLLSTTISAFVLSINAFAQADRPDDSAQRLG